MPSKRRTGNIYKKITHDLPRSIIAKKNRQAIYDPRDFLTPDRIDLAAKTLYARAVLEHNKSSWPEEVYREHLRSWHNFYEADPPKNSYEDFKKSFLATIESMVSSKKQWQHKAPVSIYDNIRRLENGSHRVSAAIAAGEKINTRATEITEKYDWNYEFFSRRRDSDLLNVELNEKYLDAMTVEYVSLKKRNIFAVVIFPSAVGHREQVYEHLKNLGEIVNMKTIKKSSLSSIEVIRQLYYGEQWATTNANLRVKADPCFAGDDDLQVYILETDKTPESMLDEKKHLRSIWNIDKHSLHITDTLEEANRAVRMFFHRNSLLFLQRERSRDLSENFKKYFMEYKRMLPKDPIESDNFCIDSGGVLDLYEIRDTNDLDYVARSHNDLKKPKKGYKIDSHNYMAKFYEGSLDEIITNPDNFVYYAGVKFVAPKKVLEFKQNRYKDKKEGNNAKDLDDIKSLSMLINEEQQSINIMKIEKPDKPLFSICVPMYGVEKYIEYSIKDIKKQSFLNFECIIVNDATTDKSAEKAKKEINDDPRFEIINHSKNRGLPVARQTALDRAKGEYVLFLDSDDRFSTDLLVEIDKTLASSKDQLDIITWDFGTTDDSNEKKDTELGWYDKAGAPRKVYSPIDIRKKLFIVNSNNVWTKCFRRKFLIKEKLKFNTDIVMGEDLLFSHSALAVADKIKFIDKKLVYYRIESTSSINSSMKSERRIHDTLLAIIALEEFLHERKLYEDFRETYIARSLADVQAQVYSIINQYENIVEDYAKDLSNTADKLSGAEAVLSEIERSRAWNLVKSIRSVKHSLTKNLRKK